MEIQVLLVNTFMVGVKFYSCTHIFEPQSKYNIFETWFEALRHPILLVCRTRGAENYHFLSCRETSETGTAPAGLMGYNNNIV